MGKKFKLIFLSISLLFCLSITFCYELGIFQRFELVLLDVFFTLRPGIKWNKNIVVIEIDEQSLRHYGAWPWSRDNFALLISAINHYRPKIIGLDIFFSESHPITDYFFIGALSEAKNVFLPLAFEGISNYKTAISDFQPDTNLDKLSLSIDPSKKDIPMHQANFIIPLHPKIYQTIQGAGHANFLPDIDGIVRHIPAFIEYHNKIFPHFALRIAEKYLNLSLDKAYLQNSKLIIPGLNPAVKKNIQIPLNEYGEILVNWASAWRKNFTYLSMNEFMTHHTKALSNQTIARNLSKLFEDNICLIGLTATGLIDIKPVPIENSFPMLGIHLNILNSLLTNNYLTELARASSKFCIFIFLFIYTLILSITRRQKLFYITTIILLTWFFISFALFTILKIHIPVFTPFIGGLGIWFIYSMINQLYNYQELKKLFKQATTDELTGLYTLRYFKYRIQEIFIRAVKFNKPFSLIIIDIDNFKNINDTYGHENGNIIISGLAELIKKNSEGNSFINARYGGEEFCILMMDESQNMAAAHAEKLLKHIRETTFQLTQKKISITVSIGVAGFPEVQCKGPENIIQAADSALYHCKKNGKDGYTIFNEKISMYLGFSSLKTQLSSTSITEHWSGYDFLTEDMKERNKELSEILNKMRTIQNEIVIQEKEAIKFKMGAFISHELNKPIHNIRNCLGIIIKEGSSNKKITEFSGYAQTELDRMAALSKQMLDFNRPQTQTIENNNINTLLNDMLRISQKLLTDKNILLETAFSEEPLILKCSGNELKQVFLNLLLNSIDAMEGISNEKIIKISTHKKNDKIVISVSDNGKGIPEELQQNIYLPFFTTKGSKGGTGLGLAICRTIVEKYWGTISLNSHINQGATFTIIFPRSI